MRLFLTDAGYSKALENQDKGFIRIRSYAKVRSGHLHYDHKDRELYAKTEIITNFYLPTLILTTCH